jgi:hypothetical protein
MAEIHPIKIGVVVRSEAEIKAEALREAADAWYGDEGPWNSHGSEATWLRARAAKIEAGGHV